MKRDECKGCLFDGKALKCATLEVEWAWYELMKQLPVLNRFAREPETCYLREVVTDEND